MTTDNAKKELMVVHRDSPIGETHEHFYSVSSVNRLIERLVGRINELEKRHKQKDDAIRLLENVLATICEATSSVEKEDTDAGLCVMPNFRWEPTFEFYEDDIEVMKWLEEQSDHTVDFSVLRNNK